MSRYSSIQKLVDDIHCLDVHINRSSTFYSNVQVEVKRRMSDELRELIRVGNFEMLSTTRLTADTFQTTCCADRGNLNRFDTIQISVKYDVFLMLLFHQRMK